MKNLIRNELGEGWSEYSDQLGPILQKTLTELNTLYNTGVVYPEKKKVFAAFRECELDKIKVVIIGDIPYRGEQASGISFGKELSHMRTPCSCEAIHTVIENTIHNGFKLYKDYDMKSYAKQGVLFLNSSLTVSADKKKDDVHKKIWNEFISSMLSIIQLENSSVIYVVWGRINSKLLLSLSPSSNILYNENLPDGTFMSMSWECDHFKKTNHLINW